MTNSWKNTPPVSQQRWQPFGRSWWLSGTERVGKHVFSLFSVKTSFLKSTSRRCLRTTSLISRLTENRFVHLMSNTVLKVMIWRALLTDRLASPLLGYCCKASRSRTAHKMIRSGRFTTKFLVIFETMSPWFQTGRRQLLTSRNMILRAVMTPVASISNKLDNQLNWKLCLWLTV